MKRVEDLIAELQQLPPEAPIFVGDTGDVELRYSVAFGEVHIPAYCDHEDYD